MLVWDPEVTATLKLLPYAAPYRHLTDVCETHSVASHIEYAILNERDEARCPSPAPLTVTDTDPVWGVLLRMVELAVITSKLNDKDKLAIEPPAVIETLDDPKEKELCRQ